MPTANEIAFNGSVAATNKVGFKVGLQDTVNTMLAQGTAANATPGHFYLTSDEHRLYIGNSNGSLSPINQGVTFVTSTTDLPQPTTDAQWKALNGRFYYVTDSNILCVCAGASSTSGTYGHWIQINPDTYLKAEGAIVTGSQTSGQNKVTITTTVHDTTNGSNSVHTASGDFKVQGNSNIDLTWDNSTNTLNIAGKDAAIYELVTESETLNNVTTAKLVLKEYNSATEPRTLLHSYPISLISGGSVTPVASNGAITFNGGGLQGATLEIDHPVGSADGTVRVKLNQSGISAQDQQNLSALLVPQIQITGTSGTETKKFTYDSTDNTLTTNLGVYSAAKVDELLTQIAQATEAMYFAGTIGQGSSTVTSLSYLASHLSSYASGATFKVVQADLPVPTGMTIDGLAANDHMEVGDMIIVTGSETNGVLDGTTITYTYIPSGNDLDEHWDPSAITNGMLWTPQTATTAKQKLVFAGDNAQITVSSATSQETTGNVNVQTITVGHKNMYSGGNGSTPTVSNSDAYYGPTAGSASASTLVTAVTGLTLENGHITGYETKNIKLKTAKPVTTVINTASASSNVATMATVYKDADNLSDVVNFNNWQVSSDTLAISATAGSVTTGQGTNADIHIDMVWGSF